MLFRYMDHNKVRVREIPVIVRISLYAAACSSLRCFIPVAGLLQYRAAVIQDCSLAPDLINDRFFDPAEGIDILCF